MRIGVIGTGAMGKNHLRVVADIPDLQLTAAVDKDPEVLKEACSPYRVRQDTSYRDIVALIDAVVVSTPTESHFEIARFFLEQGKHVLVEKPVTARLDEADHLIEIAESSSVTLAVEHPERFNPAVQYVDRMVEKPLFIEIQRLGSFSPRSLDVDVIMDLMIHDIDIILQWDRSGIDQIHASGIPIISRKVDIANARLQFNSGLVANVTASRVSQKKTRKLRIFQKDSYFSVDYKKKRVKQYSLEGGTIRETIPDIPQIEPLRTLWIQFYRAIRGETATVVTAHEARDALQIALQVSDHVNHRASD